MTGYINNGSRSLDVDLCHHMKPKFKVLFPFYEQDTPFQFDEMEHKGSSPETVAKIRNDLIAAAAKEGLRLVTLKSDLKKRKCTVLH